MNPNEAGRLAHAINDLRPDWPISSLRTFIERNLNGRTYRDTAVALAWIATDTKPDGTHASDTPKRVLENGPWWRAATVENPASLRPQPPRKAEQCTRCGGQLPDCACRREHLAATYDDDQETTRMDAAAARQAARDAIRDAKGSDEEAVL